MCYSTAWAPRPAPLAITVSLHFYNSSFISLLGLRMIAYILPTEHVCRLMRVCACVLHNNGYDCKYEAVTFSLTNYMLVTYLNKHSIDAPLFIFQESRFLGLPLFYFQKCLVVLCLRKAWNKILKVKVSIISVA